VALSILFGKRLWFHQEWTEELSWAHVQVTAYQLRPFGGGLDQW
jgi:hypothetical protein